LLQDNNSLNPNIITEFVKRAALNITVTERGQLDSSHNATLTSSVEGSATIISIVPEGTLVKEGQVVCELDSAELREKSKQQEIDLTQSKAALAQALEFLEIQKNQNESDIAAADLKLTIDKLELEKFEKGDYLQQQNEIKGEITLAKEDQTRAQENYDFSKRMTKKGYRSQNDLDADRIAVTRFNISVRIATEKLSVLENFTFKRIMAELEANDKESVRELVRVKRKAVSTLAQYEAEYKSAKLTSEVEQEKYDRLLRQIEACVLKAPQDGEVVYANNSGGRRGNDQQVIEEGATVRERQAIIKLPDVNHMKVDARIHESKIGMIRAGSKVLIRIDAYPNELFHGVIESVSSVPMSGSWPNYDLKEYETEITITDDVEKVNKLRPGLTAEIEIQVKSKADVLQVPVQSLISIGDKFIAFVTKDGESAHREVLIGETSDTAVEVLDGLAEGEEIVLNPRTSFSKKLNDLREQAKISDSSKTGKQGREKWPLPQKKKEDATDKTEDNKPVANKKSKAGGGKPE